MLACMNLMVLEITSTNHYLHYLKPMVYTNSSQVEHFYK